ncbi:YppG family protein [Bacillus sp. AFS073361]|uniref:YppG family protein n=1 Tax=Bacillus sp. AFS073361 TaxID=2033511 RepID=UPI00211D3ECE|nr:YppG family protein [Bacillus sp. AFS073361]
MFGKKRPTNYYFNNGYPGQMMHQGPVGQQRNQQHFTSNPPYLYQAPPQNFDWTLYQQQNPQNPPNPPNPYYQQAYPPYMQNYQPGHVPQSSFNNQSFSQGDSQFLFQNPLQPQEKMVQKPQYMPMNGYPAMNPYPKQSAIPKQAGGVQSFMNSFKSQDGSVDINKMVNTAGQMMNAVSQVSSLVKGFGGIFKA